MLSQTFDDETRLYVIGDVHGRLDLLERAIRAIDCDVAERGGTALTVTLGDYIDRGPQSREVIERLAVNPFPTPYVALKGNHEALLEAFLADPTVGSHWLRLGGLETIVSFGVPVRQIMLGRNYEEAAARLREALTPQHLDFLASLKTSVMVSRYFMCHAGVRPGVPLERQREVDLLWIRDEFLNSTANFGKIVVHGHTPVPEPEVLPNRINIDTGAFMTGRLTCVALEEGRCRMLKP
jgi:serine/threonine protein phosphatase 1